MDKLGKVKLAPQDAEPGYNELSDSHAESHTLSPAEQISPDRRQRATCHLRTEPFCPDAGRNTLSACSDVSTHSLRAPVDLRFIRGADRTGADLPPPKSHGRAHDPP
jgi:hypothetical protein